MLVRKDEAQVGVVVDKELWHKFRRLANKRGIKIKAAMGQAMRFWVEAALSNKYGIDLIEQMDQLVRDPEPPKPEPRKSPFRTRKRNE